MHICRLPAGSPLRRRFAGADGVAAVHAWAQLVLLRGVCPAIQEAASSTPPPDADARWVERWASHAEAESWRWQVVPRGGHLNILDKNINIFLLITSFCGTSVTHCPAVRQEFFGMAVG